MTQTNKPSSYHSMLTRTQFVFVYDKDGNEVGKFSNLKRAADAIGCTYQAIRNCIKKNHTVIKGYRLAILSMTDLECRFDV